MRKSAASRTSGTLIAGAALAGGFVLVAAAAPLLARYDPNAIALQEALQGPSRAHPLGTDPLGRDLLARLVYGARLSFLIAVPGVGAGALCGTAIGLWAGYRGGVAERAALAVVDVLLAFPGFLLALATAAALGPGAGNLVVAVGLFSFPPFVRVACSLARTLVREEYVAAARAFGARGGRVLCVHILPGALGPLLSLVALRMAAALTTASGLSFLGLGTPPPQADWGVMLEQGREYLWLAPRLVLVPGAALFLSSLGFYLLGEGLHDRAAGGR